MSTKLMSPEQQRLPPKVTMLACHDCNKYWGNNVENAVAPILKPLIAGSAVTLDAGDLRLIATWLWLKDIEYVLIRDFVWRHGEEASPMTAEQRTLWQERLQDLRRTMEPPNGYVARLGVIGGSLDPTIDWSSEPFLPASFASSYTGITSFNHFGLAVFQTTLTSPHLAEDLATKLAQDLRTYILWPPPAAPFTVPTKRLFFGAVVRWRDELRLHPDSNVRSGFTMRIPSMGSSYSPDS